MARSKSPRLKEAQKRWVMNNRSRIAALSRKSYEKNKHKRKAWEDSHKQNNKDQYMAKAKLQYNVKCGNIIRKGVCAACFKENQRTDFHHHLGYNEDNWLDVVELCRSCHKEAHGDRTHEYHPRAVNG